MRKTNFFSGILLGSMTLLCGCSAPTQEVASTTNTTSSGTNSSATDINHSSTSGTGSSTGSKSTIVGKPVSSSSRKLTKTAPLVSPLHQTYVLDDNVQYAIDAVEKSKYLGQTKKGRTASEGNLFFIVKFRAKNNGTDPVNIATEAMQVKAVDSDAYSPSGTGKEAVLINGGPKDLFESKLEPGATKPFLAIFDLPAMTIDNGAEFIIPSTKRDSTDRWVVRLDNSKRHH
jgi:hypothetical protein